ncbi:MAG: mechanosensitive ion channel family protein [Proteobacteria bacterium]|nr:mechanosensitive ion channel family protein [Pseudomonadota bacterium]
MNAIDTAALWSTLGDVWAHGYRGFDVMRAVLALGGLAVALLLRRPFARLAVRALHRATVRRRPDTTAVAGAPAQLPSPAKVAVDALVGPLQLVPVIVAVLLIAEFAVDGARPKLLLQDVGRSLVVLAVFWALLAVVGPLLAHARGRAAAFSPAMLDWTVHIARIVLIGIGAATILEIWGIHIGPVLAGFGLVGAAVALGAQDLFKNLFAGIFIIAERRFANGDWIRGNGGIEGTVEMIGLRTTRVRRFDLAPVYVPNTQLADDAVINYSQMTHYRISWTVGLTYGTSVDQLRQIRDRIEAYLLASPDFVCPPEAPVIVRIDSFGDSAINLMLYTFTRTTDWGEWLRIKEALALFIKTLVAEVGSDFAFPSQSIYVETLPTGTELYPMAPPGATPPRAPSAPAAG